jgi:release factor glutamine methyltransferase
MRRKEIFDWIFRELSGVYPQREAREGALLLMEGLLGVNRIALFLDPDVDVSPIPAALSDALAQLREHRPLQYVLGEAYFCGIPLRVDERVLIPRPETEELVSRIAGEWKGERPRILDVGTGSGAIAIALARMVPGAAITAVDISAGALELAREDARQNGVEADIDFIRLDILSDTPDGRYDVVVSNPPYVRESERAAMRRNVLDYEPASALFVPDDDPLLFYRRIAALGRELLLPGGALYFEINEAFGQQTKQLLSDAGYIGVEIRQDIFGKDRIVSGRSF